MFYFLFFGIFFVLSRYLESYEKVHFKGEDDDDVRGAKRPNTPISFAYRREISGEEN